MSLEEENQKLKQQLSHAQEWMMREIKSKKTQKDISYIEEKIYGFFPTEALSHFPSNAIDSLVSAEIIFEHIIAGEEVDGMSAILSYLKVIDQMLELYVVKGFRKALQKKTIQGINDPLEKSLRLVVEKNHTLSLGRLYQCLEIISKKSHLSPYLLELSEYIKSRTFLEKSLRDHSFLLQLKTLIHLKILGEKRHKGTLEKKDTILARQCITGNFKETTCILYFLAKTQTTL